jgi:hypothetical protein
MLQTAVVQRITTHVLRFDLLVLKYRDIYENVEKYCTAGQATDDNVAHAHCMLDNSGYKHTLKICNYYCLSTATMVARPSLSVTLYVQYIVCLAYCYNLVAISA